MSEEPAAVRLADVHKRYAGREVLRGLSLTVARGEKLVLIGRSGSGKSTLLRLLMTLERPDRGSIEIEGVPMWKLPSGVAADEAHLARVRSRVGMVFQHYNLFPHLSALDNVALAPERVRGLPRGEAETVARRWLAEVGLAERAAAMPAQLSGGQKQRVAIARALAMEPAVLLFDEVTSGLDPELVGEVLQTMRTLSEGDRTMLIVTHQMDFARRIADRVAMVHEGQVVEEGPPAELLLKPNSPITQQFLSSTGDLT
jgi:polar amino acid transport system ATP-binding protein